MSRAIVRVFNAGVRAGDAARCGEGAGLGEARDAFIEVQWQGRGGRFRHIVLGRKGGRRALRTLGVTAVFVLTVFAASLLQSSQAPKSFREAGLARENEALRAQQEALRGEAFDLAEQVVRRAEQARRLAWKVGVNSPAWDPPCVTPPAVDAGDEALVAWLTEQGMRLDAIGRIAQVKRAETSLSHGSALPQKGTELTE